MNTEERLVLQGFKISLETLVLSIQAEMSRLSGREILTFIRNPGLLECRFCPCAKADGYSCTREPEESCASAFYKFIFSEEEKHGA